jgi:23S rRNA (guanine1835-N2)-methyltransferase
MAATTFQSTYGDFTLLRRPPMPHSPLQAWDAADEYLLDESQKRSTAPEPKVLVVNDQFGALAAAFNGVDLCSWSDSYTTHRATLDNFARNDLDISRLTLLPSTLLPTSKFDLVLWRIPKAMALFREQARALPACTSNVSLILTSSMQKHFPPGALELMQQIGEAVPFPARKKARVFLLHLQHEGENVLATSAALKDEPPLQIAEYGLQLYAGPNVFARDSFDIGARFLIEQLSQLPNAARIADLGCGNGVLGIVAKQKLPAAQIEFFDESYQAIAAAEKNYCANGLNLLQPEAKFHVDDVFANYSGANFDLILCNPPFHQGHVVGDHIAWQMFAQSRKHLRPGGELWIVGNRHLEYHIKLKKIFGNCRQIASNAKFVVLAARAI